MPRISSDLKAQHEATLRERERRAAQRAEASADKVFAEVASGAIDKDPDWGRKIAGPPLNNRVPARKGTKKRK